MSKPRNADTGKQQPRPASQTAGTKAKKTSGTPIPGELTEEQLAEISAGATATPNRTHNY